MKLLMIAAVALAALVAPGAARAGDDQTTLSWKAAAVEGHAQLSWEITGTTKWYVSVIQVATRPELGPKGDFPVSNLVAYEVRTRVKQTGSWLSPFALAPGTYYAMLTLRYDGPCETGCESRSSARSFEVEPPPIGSISWTASPRSGKVQVGWTRPAEGWFVSMALVDDDRDFASPEAAVSWPPGRRKTTWTSRRLGQDTYYVRLYARYEGCDTCVWLSKVRKVEIGATNPGPRLRKASFRIVERDAVALRHTWRVRLDACDTTPGRLVVQIREETWSGGGGAVKAKVTTERLAAPDGCRAYRLTKRSVWPFRSGSYVRVVIRLRDGNGAWSAAQRAAQWYTP